MGGDKRGRWVGGGDGKIAAWVAGIRGERGGSTGDGKEEIAAWVGGIRGEGEGVLATKRKI